MNSDLIMRGSGFGEIINHSFGGPSENMVKILETFKYREFSASCQRGTPSLGGIVAEIKGVFM